MLPVYQSTRDSSNFVLSEPWPTGWLCLWDLKTPLSAHGAPLLNRWWGVGNNGLIIWSPCPCMGLHCLHPNRSKTTLLCSWALCWTDGACAWYRGAHIMSAVYMYLTNATFSPVLATTTNQTQLLSSHSLTLEHYEIWGPRRIKELWI